MGTTYRTDCACIPSAPEPERCEYQRVTDWRRDHRAWSREWKAQAKAHTRQCVDSAYYQPGG